MKKTITEQCVFCGDYWRLNRLRFVLILPLVYIVSSIELTYIHKSKYYFESEQCCNLLAVVVISIIYYTLVFKDYDGLCKGYFQFAERTQERHRVAGASGPSDLHENNCDILLRQNSFWKPIIVFIIDGHLKCLIESTIITVKVLW